MASKDFVATTVYHFSRVHNQPIRPCIERQFPTAAARAGSGTTETERSLAAAAPE